MAVITSRALLAYAHLAAPQKNKKDDGKKEKYSAQLVFTPELQSGANKADFDRFMTEARKQAIEAAQSKFGASLKLPNGTTITIEQAFDAGVLKSPFRKDAVGKGYPEGTIFMNVRTDRQPGIVYSYPDPETGRPAKVPQERIREDVYSGAYVRASINAFGYFEEGNKGVSFGLNNIQKLGDGERIDGRVAAENEFDADLSAAPADLSQFLGAQA